MTVAASFTRRSYDLMAKTPGVSTTSVAGMSVLSWNAAIKQKSTPKSKR